MNAMTDEMNTSINTNLKLWRTFPQYQLSNTPAQRTVK